MAGMEFIFGSILICLEVVTAYLKNIYRVLLVLTDLIFSCEVGDLQEGIFKASFASKISDAYSLSWIVFNFSWSSLLH